MEAQLKTFLRILNAYQDDMPLAKFLPGFFRENRQMGANDRRTASRFIYNYFRLGNVSFNLAVEERLFLAEFLCSNSANSFLSHFKPDFAERLALSLDEKLAWLGLQVPGFNLEDVFPSHQHLSDGVDKQQFLKSFFLQPDLFIRLHPGKEKLVKAKLAEEGISFEQENDFCLRLPNGTKLDQLFANEKPFEIQDLSSQRTGNFFQPSKYEYWWDACAASGGKSLLLFHQQPDIKLVVSDVRESVLENLDERFALAGLKKYQKKIVDLTQNPQPYLHHYEFDGIILDAPCSGSGTWGRTPEMINQFHEHKILQFQKLQRTIAANVVKYLKPGKPLIYITCSVFKEENEQNVNFLMDELGLKPEKKELLKGYTTKADTLFVARLIK